MLRLHPYRHFQTGPFDALHQLGKRNEIEPGIDCVTGCQNRFVVKDAVAEPLDGFQAGMNCIAPERGIGETVFETTAKP